MHFLGVLIIMLTMVTGVQGDETSVRVQAQKLESGTQYPHPMSVEIFAPWEQDGHWVLRSPETIGSNHGLLFIDHHRPDMATVTTPVDPLVWHTSPGGILNYRTYLDNGVSFAVQVQPRKKDLSIHISLTNNFLHPLDNMGTQFCLIQRGVKGFEDGWAERSYILVDGRFIPLNKTRPGLRSGEKPFFIVTNTADLDPMPPAEIERSWWAIEQADIPLIATVSEDGKRIVALAFDNAYKIMTNADIPCIHADPMFPDAAVGETVSIRGKMYFVEGKLNDLLPLFYRDFPEWRDRQGRISTK